MEVLKIFSVKDIKTATLSHEVSKSSQQMLLIDVFPQCSVSILHRGRMGRKGERGVEVRKARFKAYNVIASQSLDV